MNIAFQADNDIDQTIVRILWQTEPSMDFRTAAAVNLHGLDDLAVLELAALEKRILVSSDQSTMPGHFAEFIQTNTSYGLIIAPQSLNLKIVAAEILMIWSASEIEEWINRIVYLPL
ncbi:MAG TPA: DUF5615 family PIN-like protein [Pyrinomonadaceae bacterium]|nr:DUF5615 family PIN-like protein [Pyrinomonadaceae bacterium]